MVQREEGTLEAAAGRREDGTPSRLLVVHCGSSSLKYAFFDSAEPARDARGQVDRIGTPQARHRLRGPAGEKETVLRSAGFREAFDAMLEALVASASGARSRAREIDAVVHRIVHGASELVQPVSIAGDLSSRAEALDELAPLHDPAGVAGVREMQRLFPCVPHVAVFDTAFPHTLPERTDPYGLPWDSFERKATGRHGFHGTTHRHVAAQAAAFLRRGIDQLRMVTCHLGNGCSLSAIDRGRSVDTTLGFTPSEGLLLGTRGDLDTGVLSFLERTEGLSADDAEELLDRRSGLLDLSGLSIDMRQIESAAEAGGRRAELALRVFCYRVRKAVGAYVAALGDADAVVFTGGIGQGSARVRALVLDGLDAMGIVLDPARNAAARSFEEISLVSSPGSRIAALVVPTDEERMMAQEALLALQS